MKKKEFIVLAQFEGDGIFDNTEDVEEELLNLSSCYGTKDNFIVILNDKVYAKGKFNKEDYHLKGCLSKKSSCLNANTEVQDE